MADNDRRPTQNPSREKMSKGTWMTPPASFFGFFMAAVLNLPEKPIFETIWVIVVFLGIVALEKIADQQRKQIGGIYAFLKGGLCFFSFFLLSVFFMPNIVEQPLKLAGALIGGTIFAMAVYMPIRFQAEETSIEAREDHPDGQPQDR